MAPESPSNWLLTFHPLCETAPGRRAVVNYSQPPFVDGSCRREPHLHTELPTVTQLCRLDKGPRLRIGERLFYMTIKDPLKDGRGWALVAAMEITRTFATHDEAAAWYRAESLELPSNCVVDGNHCLPLELTTGLPADNGSPQQNWPQDGVPPRSIEEWDAHYRDRARRFSRLAVCRHLHPPALWHPSFHDDQLKRCFADGRVPNTQRARSISNEEFEALLALLRARETSVPT